MKLFLSLIFCNIFLTSGCAQENYPAIEIPSTVNYSYETIIDEIEIPWGIAFINENELLKEYEEAIKDKDKM